MKYVIQRNGSIRRKEGIRPRCRQIILREDTVFLHNIRIASVLSCSAGGMPIIAITAVRRTVLRNATGG